ncbi:MAG: hypothetical protein Q9M89_01345 [Persephonella sp.]|nr:hypothetical protein [Persephonella sp.]
MGEYSQNRQKRVEPYRLGNIQDAINEAKRSWQDWKGKKVMIIRIRKEESILKKMLQSKLSIPENLYFPQFYYLLSF